MRWLRIFNLLMSSLESKSWISISHAVRIEWYIWCINTISFTYTKAAKYKFQIFLFFFDFKMGFREVWIVFATWNLAHNDKILSNLRWDQTLEFKNYPPEASGYLFKHSTSCEKPFFSLGNLAIDWTLVKRKCVFFLLKFEWCWWEGKTPHSKLHADTTIKTIKTEREKRMGICTENMWA